MKWNINFGLGVLLTLVFTTPLLSQEELGNLWNRSPDGVYLSEESYDYTESSRAEDEVKINYLFDPLELPIRDDFTSYKIKFFVKDTNDPSVFDSLSYSFTINGKYQDSLYYVKDTTIYNYTYNPFTKKLDSNIAPSLKLNFYNDTLDPFKISDTWTVFHNYTTTTQNGITRKTFFKEDSILLDTIYKHFFAKDDPSSLWISEGAFWNRTMSKDPPTIGVITFDGLNGLGKPYDNSARLTYGQADNFTSKPINLFSDNSGRYTSSDSIYLSFFVQPFGNGDRPEPQDSIILEFYSPTQDRWTRMWSLEGDSLQPFQQIFLHIADIDYLQLGFQFRFRNYASLSGNFDHWHIDYIQLGKKREKNEPIVDVAFTKPTRTLLKLYTSVPWKHYVNSPYSYVEENPIWHLRNLGPNTEFGPCDYRVIKNGEVNPFFKSTEVLSLSVPANDTFSVKHSLNSIPNNFIFPTDTNQRQLFKVKIEFEPSKDPLENRDNDTLFHYQLFDRFYSYDDGSAEKTYQLNLVGTSVVVQFKTPIADSLRAVNINFVETFEPPTNQKVNIIVYKDLKSGPIYQSGPVDVIYNPEGKFYRYNIPPIEVDGEFYIGYQQLDQNKTYVGYDVSYNNQGRTYISQIDGDWSNSIFLGTTMIRASFGNGNEKPLANEEIIENKKELNFYPNPAQDWLYFKENIDAEIQVYSIGGKLELQEFVNNELNISELPNGFYLVKTGDQKASKLIIAR